MNSMVQGMREILLLKKQQAKLIRIGRKPVNFTARSGHQRIY
jgi:hypothetical protein